MSEYNFFHKKDAESQTLLEDYPILQIRDAIAL